MEPYISHEKYRIYNSNCLDYLKEQPDESIGFVITSPPYDNLRPYEGFEFDFEAIAKELSRCLSTGGVIIWNIYDSSTQKKGESGTSMKQALFFKEQCGLNIHDTMIYLKSNPVPESTSIIYHQAWEYIFCFSKGPPAIFNPLMRSTKHGGKKKIMKRRNAGTDGWRVSVRETKHLTRVTNVFEYTVGGSHNTSDKMKVDHPAVMHEKLAEDQILTWTNEGDTVFDPFSGAGTSGKMALINDRKYIGVEISRDYCDLSKERLESNHVELNDELFEFPTR